MASEITARAQLKALKTGASINVDVSKTNDMTGAVMSQSVQTIATTTEAIALPADLTGVPAWMCILNMDPTNFVNIGLDNANPITQIFAKLKAGQFILFPPGTATLYADADTAPVNIQVSAIML